MSRWECFRPLLLLALVAMAGAACGEEPLDVPPADCGPYPPQSTSPWILPYPVGTSYTVTQGNCSDTFGHRAEAPAARHAYDFGMPIGTPLIANRDGTVHAFIESNPDGTGRPEDNNALQIRHDDDSVTEYAHLTTSGVLVELGQRVSQGDTVALSGNSGPSTGPHLHFVVFRRVGDPTSIPVVFSNTDPHPEGLEVVDRTRLGRFEGPHEGAQTGDPAYVSRRSPRVQRTRHGRRERARRHDEAAE